MTSNTHWILFFVFSVQLLSISGAVASDSLLTRMKQYFQDRGSLNDRTNSKLSEIEKKGSKPETKSEYKKVLKQHSQEKASLEKSYHETNQKVLKQEAEQAEKRQQLQDQQDRAADGADAAPAPGQPAVGAPQAPTPILPGRKKQRKEVVVNPGDVPKEVEFGATPPDTPDPSSSYIPVF